MSGELLNCPFCGGNAKIVPEHPELDGDAWTRVYCANAECAVYPSVECFEDGHKESAIRIWNTRAQPAQAGDAVSEPIGYTSQNNLEHLRTLHDKYVVGIHRAKTNSFSVPLYTTPPHDDGKLVSSPVETNIVASTNASKDGDKDDGKVARDAERYRWLKGTPDMDDEESLKRFHIFNGNDCVTLDDEIDAAIKEQRG